MRMRIRQILLAVVASSVLLGTGCAGAAKEAATPAPVREQVTPPPTASSESPADMSPEMLTSRMPVHGYDQANADAAAIVAFLDVALEPKPAPQEAQRIWGISVTGDIAHVGIAFHDGGVDVVQGLLLRRTNGAWSIDREGEPKPPPSE